MVRETLDARIKIQAAARERLQRIDAAERVGEVGADEAARLRAESARREADELAKVEQDHRGVAAATRSVGEAAKDADEHVKAFLKDQEKAATEAAKAAEKAKDDLVAQLQVRLGDKEAMTGKGGWRISWNMACRRKWRHACWRSLPPCLRPPMLWVQKRDNGGFPQARSASAACRDSRLRELRPARFFFVVEA